MSGGVAVSGGVAAGTANVEHKSAPLSPDEATKYPLCCNPTTIFFKSFFAFPVAGNCGEKEPKGSPHHFSASVLPLSSASQFMLISNDFPTLAAFCHSPPPIRLKASHNDKQKTQIKECKIMPFIPCSWLIVCALLHQKCRLKAMPPC